jgi:hypothetical protein
MGTGTLTTAALESYVAGFKVSYHGHECQWNGPSWPMATGSVLTGFANVLTVLADGKEIARSKTLSRITGKLK